MKKILARVNQNQKNAFPQPDMLNHILTSAFTGTLTWWIINDIPCTPEEPKEGNYRITRLAVFNGNKMAGKLDAMETQSFGILTGKMSAGGMSFKVPGNLKTLDGPIISLRNVRGRTKLKTESIMTKIPFSKLKARLRLY
jgi:hypothetical protein